MDLSELVRGALTTAQQLAGVGATYTRGPSSCSVTPLPGQAGFRTDETQSLVVASDDQDWLVPVDELKFAGVPFLPQRGDKLTLQRWGKTCVYEVLPEDDQPYRMDGTGTLCRIFTKLRSRT